MGQVQFSETANLKDVFLVQNQMQDVDQGLEIQAVDSTVSNYCSPFCQDTRNC